MLMGLDAIGYTIFENFPEASTHVDHLVSGGWFLDIKANENDVILEWNPKYKSYGFTANREFIGYGEGPDEVFLEEDFQKMMKRVIDVLKTGESTEILRKK